MVPRIVKRSRTKIIVRGENLRTLNFNNCKCIKHRQDEFLRARERVIREVRTSMQQRTNCLVPRETIQQLQTQLRQDLELLERAASQS